MPWWESAEPQGLKPACFLLAPAGLKACSTPGREWWMLVRHRADFLFHFRSVHHDNGVPGASVEETPLRPFAETLFASDAQERVYLDAAEWWMIVVRYPEHAIFHRAILHAGRRSRAACAALGNDGEFFRLFLAG